MPTSQRPLHLVTFVCLLAWSAGASALSMSDPGPTPAVPEPQDLGQAPQEAARPPARAWLGQVRIPTYALGPEDPNPQFAGLGTAGIYPYTMQDRFGDELVETSYRAAFLENDLLRVVCLPQLGGRIWSVLDKISGHEVFYRNHVIKPAHLAMRGAWFAGGIEYNRGPHGHGVTSFSPVDVQVVRSPDGSAQLLIGDLEKIYGTTWQVTLSLQPGERVLQQQVRLINPTDSFRPYYFWSNAALPATPGTVLVMPVRQVSDHSGRRITPWPLAGGRDLRLLRSYDAPTSVFAYQLRFDFFGAYDRDLDLGLVHVADHRALPGRKVWTWGQSQDGVVAQQALTDSDGPYLEIQSGPLPTQARSGMLAPGQELSWSERWVPVSGLGDGFEFATEQLVVQRLDRTDAVSFRFAAVHSIPGAQIRIEGLDGRVKRARLDLSPARTPTVTVDSPGLKPAEMRFRIQVRDAEGETLLAYESPLSLADGARIQRGSEETVRSDSAPAPGDASTGGTSEQPSAETAWLAGWEAEQQGHRSQARAAYLQALQIDPGYSPALRSLGQLAFRSGILTEARERLLQALARNPADAWAWLLLANTDLRSGRTDAALDSAARARRVGSLPALAERVRGRALARQGKLSAARQAFAAGLAAGGSAWNALLDDLLMASYGAGQQRTAAAMAARATAGGTLQLVPHVIAALPDENALRRFVVDARKWLGSPEYRFVGVAADLADLGLYGDAAHVLQVATVDAVPEAERQALPMYWLAWLSARTGQKGQALGWLRRASSIPAATPWPSRVQSVEVFRYAVQRQPEDAQAWSALGNVYAALARFSEAERAWRRAVTLDPTDAVAHRNLALVAWKLNQDLPAAAEQMRQALVLAPDDATLARDLARIERERGRPDQAVQLLERYVGDQARADVVLLLAETLLETGHLDRAIELLESTRFSHREGRTSPHRLFASAHVLRGAQRLRRGDARGALADYEAALSWPDNLSVGRPARPAEAAAQYGRAQALEALGHEADAVEAYRQCVQGPPDGTEQQHFLDLCRQALANSKGIR